MTKLFSSYYYLHCTPLHCLWRDMTLFNNINRNEHSLNFYYVIKLSYALTFKLAHGETSKIVVDKKHIKNKIYLNDLKKNYYKPHFIIQNFQKNNVECHIVTEFQIWKWMWRKVFMFNSLPQRENSNHTFIILDHQHVTHPVRRKPSLHEIGHCIYAYNFKYCQLRKSSH